MLNTPETKKPQAQTLNKKEMYQEGKKPVAKRTKTKVLQQQEPRLF